MDKKETQHLLKIKKQDYPQIFNFLESLPKGTKTAHIREALMRYIAEEGQNPSIPTKSHTEHLYERSNGTYNQNDSSNQRNKESYLDYVKKQEQTNTNNQINSYKNKEDEELVDLNIDDL